MTRTTARRVAALALAVILAPFAAAAQDAPAPPDAASRLVVEQVESGWLAAPDIKFGRIDGRDAAIVGGYGGWVTDRTFLVGGGAYWLANGRHGTEMAYGGLVLEWLARTDRRIGFGARALVGGGRATLPVSPVRIHGPRPLAGAEPAIRFGVRHHGVPPPSPDPASLYRPTVLWADEFLIAEPQLNALLNVTGWCRITAGVGYRAVGGAPLFDGRLRGVSGTLAVQFGSGR